ncbi:MAG: prepilin-type N-terminal cleavage/methylation domain-containing protein [Burkholderiales bacterium]
MRRTLPERGFTLVELVVSIVVVGIIVGTVVFFVTPLRQANDIAVRAELADIADNALQRVGRDVRLALPNSVRVTASAGVIYLEFIQIRTAGRYRASGGGTAGGTNCANNDTALTSPDNDQLSFDLAGGDTCFKTIGKLPDASTVATGSDRLVLNNFGPGYTGQDAYQTAGTLNWVTLGGLDTTETSRDRLTFAATSFQRALHDLPGKRFYIISGPVTYECNASAGTLRRYWGYALGPTQPTTFGGSSALVAERVSACSFDYTPSVTGQYGLLTLQLQLQKARFDGSLEQVGLYDTVHVNNTP